MTGDPGLAGRNYTAWTEELAGMRRILELQAGVNQEEVRHEKIEDLCFKNVLFCAKLTM